MSSTTSDKKILAVFGATGNQGGSVISRVLSTPSLSSIYSIRALTRDPNSKSAESLRAQGVTDIVAADLNNPSALPGALKGAHTVFLNTATDPKLVWQEAKPFERDQGIRAADACVEAGVDYLIFSTLPHVEKGSGGKYIRCSSFDGKAEAEEYMRSLSSAGKLRTAFFAPGSFMQNWTSALSRSQVTPEGEVIISRPYAAGTKLPLIDIAEDTGKFVGAILSSPDAFEGKTLCAATGMYSLDEICAAIGKRAGKKVSYRQIAPDEFKGRMRGMSYADVMIDMMLYQQDFGYYGAETESLVKEAAEAALGEVTSFEDFLKREMVIS